MTSRDPVDRALEDAQGILHQARRHAKVYGYYAGGYTLPQVDEAIRAIQKVRDERETTVGNLEDLLAEVDLEELRALAESPPTTGWPELIREMAIEELEERQETGS